MIKQVAIKEVKLLFRDRRFVALAIVLVVLQLLAVAFGWRQHQRYAQERADATSAIRKQWVEQEAKDPHAAAHFGIHVFPERPQFALIDSGLTPYMGVSLFLEAHKQNFARYRPAQDSPIVDYFGELSLATILRVLFPLLLIILTYSTLSAEKEGGTYRLSLALGLKPFQFAVGKLIGTLSVVILFTLPGALVGLIPVLVASGSITPATLLKALFLLTGYLLYCVSILGITLALSALLPSRYALIALSGFWILNSFVVPIAATNLAQSKHAVPTVQEFQKEVVKELTGGESGHSISTEKYDTLYKETLAKYGVKRMEDLPFNYFGYSLQRMEESDSLVYAKHLASLRAIYARQDSLVLSFGLLAPGLLIRNFSMSLAGTDRDSYQRFSEQAEQYRVKMVKTLNEYIAFESKNSEKVIGERSLFERIPPFTATPESLNETLARQTPTMIGLSAWAIVSVSLAVFFSTRMRPE